jgi:chemotaxis signal transduction protein
MLLFFRCAGVDFALPVDAIERASWLLAVQPLPEASDYVVGVTALGGESVLLVDLALRLGLGGSAHYGVHTPVLWCRGGGRRAGLVVDEIDGVDAAAAGEADLAALLSGGRAPLSGAVRRGGCSWLLLDAERLLAFDLAQAVSELRLDRDALQQWMLAGAVEEEGADD